ncbi:C13 family peptidase [Undibacterium fentianense]|uniref:C13 family peptidase n=1 Tax=Undibacterium fentianense TaxID=2828728 RepID=UPI0034DCF0B9
MRLDVPSEESPCEESPCAESPCEESPCEESPSPIFANRARSDVETANNKSNFLAFVVAVFRASVYRKFSTQGWEGSWAFLLVLVLISVLIQLIADVTQVGSRGQIVLYGMPGLLFYIPVSLLSAIIVLARTQQARQLSVLTMMFSGLYLIHQLCYLLAIEIYRLGLLRTYLPDWRPSFDLAMALWISLAAAIATIRIVRVQQIIRRALTVFVVGALLSIPLFGMYKNASLWIPDYRADQDGDEGAVVSDYDILNQEAIFYTQPSILKQQLERIQASTDADPQMFFIGVAGYASQNVFMNEVKFVEQLFQQRFNTANHSIRLINNKLTVNETSIASLTALQAAIDKVGTLMRSDRDVLFLYLTSHGSKTHEFSLEFGGMQFKQLNPQVLKTMLDQAGIKHRVIVISACYSGGYIEPLKNPNSLIITSAAADKTSFGCSNDAEYTYFGKAFFVDALGSDLSFVEAFAVAKPAIDAREKKEEYEPSHPQIFVGEEIQAKLDRLKKSTRTSQSTDKEEIGARGLAFVDTVDRQRRQELAQSLIDAFDNEAQSNALHRLCLDEQALTTAEKIYKDNPSYFGGISPSSHSWPLVVSALKTYQEQACKTLDSRTFSAVLVDHYANSHSVIELEKMLKFYRSDLGRQSINTNNAAYLKANRMSYRIATENNARANEEFSREIGRLIADSNRKR